MKSKILEHSSNRLSIIINYQDEQILSGILVISGISILVLTYLDIAPKVLSSFIQVATDALSIFCYIAGLYLFIYGLFKLYNSFLISKFAFDKVVNKLEIERKNFANVSKQIFSLSEVTGVEEVSKPKATPELFLWIKKGNQVRGEKIPFVKASMTSLHMLWREVSEFLKDQPNLILNREWLIEQDQDKFKLYRKDPTKIAYTVERKKEGYLIYEVDGKEVGRYKTQNIRNVETEINPDDRDEDRGDRMVLTMNDDSKIPISDYCNFYDTGSHTVNVRALKYGLGLEKNLHISPSFYAP
ncbi:MAG: hypothetical protein IM550_14525 [Microcystis sp. M54BS1]|uniref:hypothetical protein n=1 Tax=unclassified Microcystis TaxID=2643300 RepID=UPI00257F4FFF|nr:MULTISPECIES: hypothetical protein [unclassified Microcystis]MCA2540383.1 hypothetical protein [Microcystis sp. M54BS1]MCA2598460.1 hypothetical protein [Microcystis sp. M38BS1]MCA2610940.1 hypothetical protein [Microcystis sp. M27BS1]MCA2504551.1 hypothetical protein [Microcystis sp. M62BS1]MCA2512892.1 hypothetical protein [Microcystis sp. M60BS1]